MSRSRVRHTATLAAAAVALTGAVGAATTTTAAPASAAEAAPVKLRIVQHNTDQRDYRWNKVVAMAESGNWDAVTAQEVCSGWYEALKAKHPDWTIVYRTQQKKSDCPGGAKGNVAIHPGPGSTSKNLFKVAGEDKQFSIVCVAFTKATRKVHACSTHFTVYAKNPADVRLRQAQRVKEITGKWIRKGHAVVVAGDLNTSPSAAALNPIYQFPAGRSTGNFVEAAQLKSKTAQRVGGNTVKGRKIDYVFFSTNRTPLSAGGSLELISTKTDDDKKEPHKILQAVTTLR